jgi:hypothetical protein
MDYLSILPNEIRCEIYSYLTPQEILHSCCLNKLLVKFLTEEFWCQHVTKTYSPQDFGIDKFDSNVLAYLNQTLAIKYCNNFIGRLLKLLVIIGKIP